VEQANQTDRKLILIGLLGVVAAALPLPNLLHVLGPSVGAKVYSLIAPRTYGWQLCLLALAVLAVRHEDWRTPLFAAVWQAWLVTALVCVAVAVGYAYTSAIGTGIFWASEGGVARLWVQALAVWQVSLIWRAAAGRPLDRDDWCLIAAAGLAGSHAIWPAVVGLVQGLFEIREIGVWMRAAPGPEWLGRGLLQLALAQWLALRLGQDPTASQAASRARLAWAGWCLGLAWMLVALHGYLSRGSLFQLTRNLLGLASLLVGPLVAVLALAASRRRATWRYDVPALAGFVVAAALALKAMTVYGTGVWIILLGR